MKSKRDWYLRNAREFYLWLAGMLVGRDISRVLIEDIRLAWHTLPPVESAALTTVPSDRQAVRPSDDELEQLLVSTKAVGAVSKALRSLAERRL